MKLTFRPEPKNEARLTISWQHEHMTALLAGKIEEIIVVRSDKTITIKPNEFELLRFEAKSKKYWVANYSKVSGV